MKHTEFYKKLSNEMIKKTTTLVRNKLQKDGNIIKVFTFNNTTFNFCIRGIEAENIRFRINKNKKIVEYQIKYYRMPYREYETLEDIKFEGYSEENIKLVVNKTIQEMKNKLDYEDC